MQSNIFSNYLFQSPLENRCLNCLIYYNSHWYWADWFRVITIYNLRWNDVREGHLTCIEVFCRIWLRDSNCLFSCRFYNGILGLPWIYSQASCDDENDTRTPHEQHISYYATVPTVCTGNGMVHYYVTLCALQQRAFFKGRRVVRLTTWQIIRFLSRRFFILICRVEIHQRYLSVSKVSLMVKYVIEVFLYLFLEVFHIRVGAICIF